MPVISSGGFNHATRLSDMIREHMSRTMPRVAEALLTDAKSRAPSMDEEYAELNAEAGTEPLVPRAGGNSADTDGRTRFEKNEATYLANAVPNIIENAQVISGDRILGVRVGNISFLNRVTHFSYTNTVGRGGSIDHTVPANEQGYFSMFEGGTAGAVVSGAITTFTVVPHEARRDGGTYPLRPGEGPDGARTSMVKSIRGRAMFAPFDLQQVASAVLSSALAEIGPGR